MPGANSVIVNAGKPWRRAIVGAAVLYVLAALGLGLRSPGPHYDETLQEWGGVHVLVSSAEPVLNHDTGSWVHILNKWWPVMVMPYVGGIKDYLVIPGFAIFGPGYVVGRIVWVALGAFGIWGIGRSLGQQVGYPAGAAVALILAVHPSYLDFTVYDNSGFAAWMACYALIGLLFCRYLRRRSGWVAFWLGFAMGLGVWERANFAWFLVSAVVAGGIAFWRRILPPWRHVTALVAGGALGAAPLIVYNILSKGGMFSFFGHAQLSGSFSATLTRRLYALFETMLADGEQRRIWEGPKLPHWAVYCAAGIMLLALALSFARNNRDAGRWQPAAALTFVFYAAFMLTSRLPVDEHHLFTLLPIGVLVVVLAFQGLARRSAWAKPAVIAVCVIFLSLAASWNLATARGLRRTGGLNPWSDAICDVSDYIQSHYPDRQLWIMDWGLQNNLFVVSAGRIKSAELFWGATRGRCADGRSWNRIVAQGGLYLMALPGAQYSPAGLGFHDALEKGGYPFTRTEFYQKEGRPYAELIDVASH